MQRLNYNVLEKLARLKKVSGIVDQLTNKKLRHLAIELESPTLHSMALAAYEKMKGPGATKIRSSLNYSRKKLSDLDSYVGLRLGGRQNNGWKSKFFWDDDARNLVPVRFVKGKKQYITPEEIDAGVKAEFHEPFAYPSVSKPIKSVSNFLVPTLAFTKGNEIVEHYVYGPGKRPGGRNV